MSISVRFLSIVTASLLTTSLIGIEAVYAAAIARSDAEFDLRIDGITAGADLEIVGRGSRQVGPITPAVNSSFNQVRIAGIVPADGDPVAFGLGQSFEIDAQSDVRTQTLLPGESAELLVEVVGEIDITNHSAFDVTINFFYEREYFLTSGFLGTPDPVTEKSFSHGIFEILGQSFDTSGTLADEFSRSFDQAVADGVSANPEEKFNFDFMVPAGGTARFDMAATAYSRVALVPEPGAIVLACFALFGLATVARNQR